MLHRRTELGALAARYPLLTFREGSDVTPHRAKVMRKTQAASFPELVRMAERLFPGRDQSLD